MKKILEKIKNKKILVILFLAIIITITIFIFMNKSSIYEPLKMSNQKYFLLNQDYKVGIIDSDGNIIIEPNYDNINIPNPEKGVFICLYEYNQETGEYKSKVLNEKNEEILKQYSNVNAVQIEYDGADWVYEKEIVKYKENSKYGLANIEGKKLTEAIYDDITSNSGKEGYLIITKEGKQGILTAKGKEIIKPKYEEIYFDGYRKEIKDSGFIVKIKTTEGYRYGYTDIYGNEFLKPEYNELYRIYEIENDKYFTAIKNGRSGIIKNKKELIKFEYQQISYESTSNLFTINKNSKIGLANIKGEIIVPTEYDNIILGKTRAILTKNDENIVVDLKGNKLEMAKFADKIKIENTNYYIVQYLEDFKYGIIDESENKITKNTYDYLENLYDKYYIAYKDEKKCIISATGEELTKLDTKDIYNLNNYNIVIIQNAQNNNVEIYNNNIEKIKELKNMYLCNECENVVEIYTEEGIYYFNKNGQEVTEKEAYPDIYLYVVLKNGKYGFIDKDGNVKVKEEYDQVTRINSYGFAGIKKDGKWGVINKNGQIIIEPTYEIDEKNPEFLSKYYKEYTEYGDYYTSK